MKKLWAWIVSLFRKDAVAPAKVASARVRRSKEHYGAHYYLGDLLDRLDGVFQDLPKLKKADPDAYALFSKFGATVASSDALFSQQIEPYILKHLPSFACFHLDPNNSKKDDIIYASFVYVVKEKKPVNVQASNGAIYRVGGVFILDGKPFVVVFYVAINADGSLNPLKTCAPRQHAPGFVRMEWDYPEHLLAAAREQGRTVQEFVDGLVPFAINSAMTRDSGLTIRVRKGGLAAAFAIDMQRTPYFFADREKTVTENGQTKKIFHIVRGHWRQGAGGNRKWIKSHFRGLREFTWNGYQVKIALSGKHGVGLSELDFSSVDAREDGPKYAASEVSEKLDGLIA